MDTQAPKKSTPKNKKTYKFSDFQIIEKLGSGTFGVIFKVKQKESGQIVAIKIMSKKKFKDQHMYNRVKNEIQIQSRLRFTHICLLYCYFHDKQNVYLVLEYCPNNTLYYHIIQNKKILTEIQIVKYAHQLLSAVAYLHERHVIHRDIKLQNLLLDQNNDIKLTDFGCCIHTRRQQRTFCGTLEYIPPQMVEQKRYDEKVDIYCVGIIIYELFYHFTPFKGKNQEETLKNINMKDIKFDNKIREISQQAKEFICLLLRRNPTYRPSVKQALKHQFIGRLYKKNVYQSI